MKSFYDTNYQIYKLFALPFFNKSCIKSWLSCPQTKIMTPFLSSISPHLKRFNSRKQQKESWPWSAHWKLNMLIQKFFGSVKTYFSWFYSKLHYLDSLTSFRSILQKIKKKIPVLILGNYRVIGCLLLMFP